MDRKEVATRGSAWRAFAVRGAATIAAVIEGLYTAATRRERGAVALKPCDSAPEFSLAGSDGRTYRLADLVAGGPIAIAWFPKAFTGGCTVECASMGASGGELEKFRGQYFAASVDTPGANRRFAGSLGLEFPVLSDPSKATARAYGVLAPSGFARRWTFYIGRDGRVLDIDKQVNASTHGRDIARRLASLTS